MVVTEYTIKIRDINSLKDAAQAIKDIGSDPKSIPIMSPKMINRVIQIDNVVLQDAIIIKQDMLSVGGEVAVPRKTFELHQEKAAILISGTVHQLRLLVNKLNRHYPRIRKISSDLETIIDQII